VHWSGSVTRPDDGSGYVLVSLQRCGPANLADEEVDFMAVETELPALVALLRGLVADMRRFGATPTVGS
jgi:hypothetical protein